MRMCQGRRDSGKLRERGVGSASARAVGWSWRSEGCWMGGRWEMQRVRDCGFRHFGDEVVTGTGRNMDSELFGHV
jgi:hypothetical protein